MRSSLFAAVLAGLLPALAFGQAAKESATGTSSRGLPLAPVEEIESAAIQQYRDLVSSAARHRALAPEEHPPLHRVRAIAERLIERAPSYNRRASQWKWEVNLIGSRHLNVLCMPGGKIAVFTGIIDALRLNDDELAFAIAHEIAHALQEHARERVGRARPADWLLLNSAVFAPFLGYGDSVPQPATDGNKLLILKYTNDDESDADGVGLELAARAGFDPRAALSFWQKVSNTQGLPAWLLTHPAYNARIRDIEARLPALLPIYAKATGQDPERLPAYAMPAQGKPEPGRAN
ncbi:MAG TPA: M48 family metallopeptidase [Burkholderiaceae bacterium]|nr:M48 family metallopeptidase [Burkholderiaceae bacterium]